MCTNSNKKYLFIYEDSIWIYEDELHSDDIENVKTHDMAIIRQSNLKILSYDGISWNDIERIEYDR